MSQLPKLNKVEWETMMASVLTDGADISGVDKWGSIQSPGNNVGTPLMEIPDNHPPAGGPKSLDSDDEIPAGGGFDTKPAATPVTGPVSKEIPSDGPSSSDSPADKPDKAPADKFVPKVDRPGSTGKPAGSFAGLTMDGDSWTAKGPIVPTGTVTWDSFPTGKNDGTGPDGTPDKTAPENRAPKANGSSASEDLSTVSADNLQLPDGTFFTANTDDLQNNIDKVKNAEQANPDPKAKPWYGDIKRHLMNRAADLGATHLIPADWQLSMAMLAELEMARDIDTAVRDEYAKKGWSLPDGSYPIGSAHDLQNAIILARSGHGNVAAAKALIRRRAKELKVTLPVDMK